MSGSAGTLGGPAGEQLVVNPEGEGLAVLVGLGLQGRPFGAGHADADDLVAGLASDGRPSGSGCHAHENNRPRNNLTTAILTGHNSHMETMAEQPTPTRGSGPVECDDPRCHGHRAQCIFGRDHRWYTWFQDGQLMRTEDTFYCVNCGGVCVGDEPESAVTR